MLPVLRFHRPTRQFYVWISDQKKRLHFGRDAQAARRKYAEWLAGLGGEAALPPPSRMTVSDALEAYRRHAEQKYASRQARHRVAAALRAVGELYGRQPAGTFRAKALRDVRERLAGGGRSRAYVNQLVRTIQTAWRWLASEELVPADAAVSVGMVRALGPGEGGAERGPVLPPAPGAVDATLPHLPPTVAAMVRFQLLTGARPGEVCRMRADEVSRDPGQPVPLPGTGRTVAALRCGGTVVWVYAPGRHKTARRGKSRVVPVGPRAQAEVRDRLGGGLVFPTPRGTAYRADSYAKAVQRACEAAGVTPWTPNTLRHAAATEVSEHFDEGTAAAVLGHAPGSSATRTYLEQATRKAAEAAARIG